MHLAKKKGYFPASNRDTDSFKQQQNDMSSALLIRNTACNTTLNPSWGQGPHLVFFICTVLVQELVINT